MKYEPGDAHNRRDEGTMSLAEALRAAADHTPDRLPPPAVAAAAQAALRQRVALQAARAQVAARPAARSLAARVGAWSGATAVFASVAIGSVVLLVLVGEPPNFVPQQAAFEASDFVPLLPPERWPADTAGGASPAFLVRTELPGQRLAALGLPFDPAFAGARRPAELLVHPSGEVLAVRLVP